MTAICGIVATSVGIAIKHGKFVVVPIKRQFSYLCCLSSNMQSLENESEKLAVARRRLEEQKVAAENKGDVIYEDVEEWLQCEGRLQDKMREFLLEVPNVKFGLFNIRSRYSLSKRAKQTTEAMKEHRDNCRTNRISHSIPPAAQASTPLRQFHEFQSRRDIEENIMKSLTEQKANMIGICGMGGLGKTTMATRIMNRAREVNLFDECAMAVVSQEVDKLKVQLEIGEALGLEKLKTEDTIQARAHTLRARLTGNKKTLIVIDDIWEQVNLEELGIPIGNSRCIVILISRVTQVLAQMDAEIYTMHILTDGEAQTLFRHNVGISAEESNLVSLAKEIARECQGLPIALIAVARALRNEKSTNVWKVALRQLQNSELDRNVYVSLKLSYDYLNNQEQRFVFLLCSMFPEDSLIDLEELFLYCLGLDFFDGVSALEETRQRLHAVVGFLKGRGLLLDQENMHEVKMHDVVRDVARSIASEERLFDVHPKSQRSAFESDSKWIVEFPTAGDGLSYLRNRSLSSVRFLLIQFAGESYGKTDFSYLEGMKEIKVLSFKNISSPLSFEVLQFAKNLRTLRLEHCNLKNISSIGELSSLEILICIECGVDELPYEIGKLKLLKLLEFVNCRSLERIVAGVISNLVELEELRISGSFNRWEWA